MGVVIHGFLLFGVFLVCGFYFFLKANLPSDLFVLISVTIEMHLQSLIYKVFLLSKHMAV